VSPDAAYGRHESAGGSTRREALLHLLQTLLARATGEQPVGPLSDLIASVPRAKALLAAHALGAP